MCLSVSYAWIGTGPQEIQSSCHKPSEENALPKKQKTIHKWIEETEEGVFVYLTSESAAEWATLKKKKIWISTGGFAVILPVKRNFGQQMPADVESYFFWKWKTTAGGTSREPLLHAIDPSPGTLSSNTVFGREELFLAAEGLQSFEWMERATPRLRRINRQREHLPSWHVQMVRHVMWLSKM